MQAQKKKPQSSLLHAAGSRLLWVIDADHERLGVRDVDLIADELIRDLGVSEA
jgi:hypothetical protein